MKFQVSLTGASGPATRALAAILVDREQKIAMFGKEWDAARDPNKLFLNELQRRIRTTFTDMYFNKLEEKLGANQFKELKTTVRLYLSTVLYRYFLPFLTWEDEHRIYNGMQVFLIALRHISEEKFGTSSEDMKKFEDGVLACLKEVLQNFRGVEALYKVTVEVESDEKDQRRIVDIQLASVSDSREVEAFDPVNCLFGQRKAESDTDSPMPPNT